MEFKGNQLNSKGIPEEFNGCLHGCLKKLIGFKRNPEEISRVLNGYLGSIMGFPKESLRFGLISKGIP